MVFHFTKVILRFFSRQFFYTGLNIIGLSTGIASCIVIFLFITHELSYDNFHRDGERIFRVIRQSQINGMPYNIGVTSGPFATALKQDYDARIESVTRALAFDALVTYKDQSFAEERLLLTDKNFFDFFSFPLRAGDPSSVFENGNSLVISAALATKYFGSEDPIGKMIRLDDQYDLIVTGVMEEWKGNSHLQFDAVGSLDIAEGEDWMEDWWSNSFYTYVKLRDAQDALSLNASFPAFMEKYFGKDFERVGNRIGLKLEPRRDIYCNFDTRYEEDVAHGDRRYVYIFGTIGCLLLLLAGINYINLATAQSSTRAREVGIRKTLGSAQGSVAARFLSESFILCLFSAVLATGVAQVSIPILNAQFGTSIPQVFGDLRIFIFLLILVTVLALAAGAYPSFLLSSFKPADVLKGNVRGNLRYILVRKALVIFQFGISGFMIISTLFISEQLAFMRQKDLGFQADQLMVVKVNNGLINRERLSFRESLLRENEFSQASLTSGYPGGFYDATTIKIEGEEDNIRMRTLWTDPEFLETMDLSMKAGRFFSRTIPADSFRSVVLNETAVRQLGWTADEAIGKRVMVAQFDSVYKEVVGVIEDYHFTSLKQKIEPLIISYLDGRGNLLVRISGTDVTAAVSRLEKVWSSYNTGFPLEFVFLDDLIQRLYTSETVQGKIFTMFSIISVLIASLGILGLGAYIASQRTKEIGVRKVLGASTGQVSALLMKDLLMLVLIANVIAIPAGYWTIRQWLQGFAYRIELSPLVFVAGAALMLLIATLIVGVNASRVARQNPVNSLRTE